MSVESELTDHVISQMAIAYPGIDPDQIIVAVPSGAPDFAVRGKNCIGSETLTLTVTVASEEPLDRDQFWRKFPRKNINTSNYQVFQEYRGHEFYDRIEVLGYKGTVFKINYKRSIYEEAA